MKNYEHAWEDQSRVTTNINSQAWLRAWFGEPFSINGKDMKRLMSTFGADLPGNIWVGFDYPDYKFDLDPRFLANAYEPEIMSQRVEVLAVTLSEPEPSRMHAA